MRLASALSAELKDNCRCLLGSQLFLGQTVKTWFSWLAQAWSHQTISNSKVSFYKLISFIKDLQHTHPEHLHQHPFYQVSLKDTAPGRMPHTHYFIYCKKQTNKQKRLYFLHFKELVTESPGGWGAVHKKELTKLNPDFPLQALLSMPKPRPRTEQMLLTTAAAGLLSDTLQTAGGAMHTLDGGGDRRQQRRREGLLSGAHLYTLWCKQRLCDKTRVHLLTPLLVQKWCPKAQRERRESQGVGPG